MSIFNYVNQQCVCVWRVVVCWRGMILSSSFSQSVSSVAQSCPTLCDLMDCSTPGLPVHHQLPEFTQTHVHWVGDAIQPSHPLSSASPPASLFSQPFSAIPPPPPCPLASPVYPPKEVMDLWSSEILSILNFGVNILQLCCLSSRETFFLDKHLWLREPSNRLETWGLRVLTLSLPWHSVWPWAIHLISVQTLWCLITGFSRNLPASKDIWNHSLVPQGKATLHYPSGFKLSFSTCPPPHARDCTRLFPSLGTTFLLFFPKTQQFYSILALPRIQNFVPKHILHRIKLPRQYELFRPGFCPGLHMATVNRRELNFYLIFCILQSTIYCFMRLHKSFLYSLYFLTSPFIEND